MLELSFKQHASANSGANCQVDNVIKAASCAEDSFSQAGCINVSIVSNGNVQSILQRLQQIEVAPTLLRRREDLSVARQVRIDSRGAKCTHT